MGDQLFLLRACSTVLLAFCLLIKPAAAGENPVQPPQAQFRILCSYVKTLNDDPIVKPHQRGASHNHDFFGAVNVTADTTDGKDLLKMKTSCNVKADTASYWYPSLFERVGFAKGKPVYRLAKPTRTLFYYRVSINSVDKVQAPPFGLKLVAGNPNAVKHEPNANIEWWCEAGIHYSNFVPTKCPPGKQLIAKVNAPSCWDCKNLDSPDHKSHMAYPLWGGDKCPPTHPCAIPRISNKVYWRPSPDTDNWGWPKTGLAGAPAFHLSTVETGGDGSGFGYHMDFLNGWNMTILRRLVDRCINQNKKCLAQDTLRIANEP